MSKGHYYRGKYQVKYREKYEGDPSLIVYRSLWERQVFKWCDTTPEVVCWNSEETVIPYRCRSDGKMHRYFVDLKVVFADGKTYLIEIKPKKQTQEPRIQTRKTRAYITEVLTYAKNMSKWEAALEYCADRGWTFEIWTEETLKKLGIKLLT